MALKVVILTGVRNADIPLLEGTPVRNKVLLPVGGKPMVLSVFEAAIASKYRPEIYISTEDPQVKALETPASFKTLPVEGSAAQSFLKSIERMPGDDPILFISGDHPLLTPEMIDYFVDEALRKELTLAVAVVEKSVVERSPYARTKRTYFHAKGEGYSGANLFLVDKKRFQGDPHLIQLFETNRKKPWKTATAFGFPFLIKVLLRQLDMHEIARHCSQIIGCNCDVVEMPFAESCMDVDKPSDKELAEIILAERAGLPLPEILSAERPANGLPTVCPTGTCL